jgi:transcriptional regulator with XRE-family HTH domain
MVAMISRSLATNEWVAQQLDLTHSTISRIRSGDRLPSIPVMDRIEERFGWRTELQMVSRRKGTYAHDFEIILGRRYA